MLTHESGRYVDVFLSPNWLSDAARSELIDASCELIRELQLGRKGLDTSNISVCVENRGKQLNILRYQATDNSGNEWRGIHVRLLGSDSFYTENVRAWMEGFVNAIKSGKIPIVVIA
jgi:hypothetical protein